MLERLVTLMFLTNVADVDKDSVFSIPVFVPRMLSEELVLKISLSQCNKDYMQCEDDISEHLTKRIHTCCTDIDVDSRSSEPLTRLMLFVGARNTLCRLGQLLLQQGDLPLVSVLKSSKLKEVENNILLQRLPKELHCRQYHAVMKVISSYEEKMREDFITLKMKVGAETLWSPDDSSTCSASFLIKNNLFQITSNPIESDDRFKQDKQHFETVDEYDDENCHAGLQSRKLSLNGSQESLIASTDEESDDASEKEDDLNKELGIDEIKQMIRKEAPNLWTEDQVRVLAVRMIEVDVEEVACVEAMEDIHSASQADVFEIWEDGQLLHRRTYRERSSIKSFVNADDVGNYLGLVVKDSECPQYYLGAIRLYVIRQKVKVFVKIELWNSELQKYEPLSMQDDDSSEHCTVSLERQFCINATVASVTKTCLWWAGKCCTVSLPDVHNCPAVIVNEDGTILDSERKLKSLADNEQLNLKCLLHCPYTMKFKYQESEVVVPYSNTWYGDDDLVKMLRYFLRYQDPRYVAKYHIWTIPEVTETWPLDYNSISVYFLPERSVRPFKVKRSGESTSIWPLLATTTPRSLLYNEGVRKKVQETVSASFEAKSDVELYENEPIGHHWKALSSHITETIIVKSAGRSSPFNMLVFGDAVSSETGRYVPVYRKDLEQNVTGSESSSEDDSSVLLNVVCKNLSNVVGNVLEPTDFYLVHRRSQLVVNSALALSMTTQELSDIKLVSKTDSNFKTYKLWISRYNSLTLERFPLDEFIEITFCLESESELSQVTWTAVRRLLLKKQSIQTNDAKHLFFSGSPPILTALEGTIAFDDSVAIFDLIRREVKLAVGYWDSLEPEKLQSFPLESFKDILVNRLTAVTKEGVTASNVVNLLATIAGIPEYLCRLLKDNVKIESNEILTILIQTSNQVPYQFDAMEELNFTVTFEDRTKKTNIKAENLYPMTLLEECVKVMGIDSSPQWFELCIHKNATETETINAMSKEPVVETLLRLKIDSNSIVLNLKPANFLMTVELREENRIATFKFPCYRSVSDFVHRATRELEVASSDHECELIIGPDIPVNSKDGGRLDKLVSSCREKGWMDDQSIEFQLKLIRDEDSAKVEDSRDLPILEDHRQIDSSPADEVEEEYEHEKLCASATADSDTDWLDSDIWKYVDSHAKELWNEEECRLFSICEVLVEEEELKCLHGQADDLILGCTDDSFPLQIDEKNTRFIYCSRSAVKRDLIQTCEPLLRKVLNVEKPVVSDICFVTRDGVVLMDAEWTCSTPPRLARTVDCVSVRIRVRCLKQMSRDLKRSNADTPMFENFESIDCGVIERDVLTNASVSSLTKFASKLQQNVLHGKATMMPVMHLDDGTVVESDVQVGQLLDCERTNLICTFGYDYIIRCRNSVFRIAVVADYFEEALKEEVRKQHPTLDSTSTENDLMLWPKYEPTASMQYDGKLQTVFVFPNGKERVFRVKVCMPSRKECVLPVLPTTKPSTILAYISNYHFKDTNHLCLKKSDCETPLPHEQPIGHSCSDGEILYAQKEPIVEILGSEGSDWSYFDESNGRVVVGDLLAKVCDKASLDERPVDKSTHFLVDGNTQVCLRNDQLLPLTTSAVQLVATSDCELISLPLFSYNSSGERSRVDNSTFDMQITKWADGGVSWKSACSSLCQKQFVQDVDVFSQTYMPFLTLAQCNIILAEDTDVIRLCRELSSPSSSLCLAVGYWKQPLRVHLYEVIVECSVNNEEFSVVIPKLGIVTADQLIRIAAAQWGKPESICRLSVGGKFVPRSTSVFEELCNTRTSTHDDKTIKVTFDICNDVDINVIVDETSFQTICRASTSEPVSSVIDSALSHFGIDMKCADALQTLFRPTAVTEDLDLHLNFSDSVQKFLAKTKRNVDTAEIRLCPRNMKFLVSVSNEECEFSVECPLYKSTADLAAEIGKEKIFNFLNINGIDVVPDSEKTLYRVIDNLIGKRKLDSNSIPKVTAIVIESEPHTRKPSANSDTVSIASNLSSVSDGIIEDTNKLEEMETTCDNVATSETVESTDSSSTVSLDRVHGSPDTSTYRVWNEDDCRMCCVKELIVQNEKVLVHSPSAKDVTNVCYGDSYDVELRGGTRFSLGCDRKMVKETIVKKIGSTLRALFGVDKLTENDICLVNRDNIVLLEDEWTRFSVPRVEILCDCWPIRVHLRRITDLSISTSLEHSVTDLPQFHACTSEPLDVIDRQAMKEAAVGTIINFACSMIQRNLVDKEILAVMHLANGIVVDNSEKLVDLDEDDRMNLSCAFGYTYVIRYLSPRRLALVPDFFETFVVNEFKNQDSDLEAATADISFGLWCSNNAVRSHRAIDTKPKSVFLLARSRILRIIVESMRGSSFSLYVLPTTKPSTIIENIEGYRPTSDHYDVCLRKRHCRRPLPYEQPISHSCVNEEELIVEENKRELSVSDYSGTYTWTHPVQSYVRLVVCNLLAELCQELSSRAEEPVEDGKYVLVDAETQCCLHESDYLPSSTRTLQLIPLMESEIFRLPVIRYDWFGARHVCKKSKFELHVAKTARTGISWMRLLQSLTLPHEQDSSAKEIFEGACKPFLTFENCNIILGDDTDVFKLLRCLPNSLHLAVAYWRPFHLVPLTEIVIEDCDQSRLITMTCVKSDEVGVAEIVKVCAILLEKPEGLCCLVADGKRLNRIASISSVEEGKSNRGEPVKLALEMRKEAQISVLSDGRQVTINVCVGEVWSKIVYGAVSNLGINVRDETLILKLFNLAIPEGGVVNRERTDSIATLLSATGMNCETAKFDLRPVTATLEVTAGNDDSDFSLDYPLYKSTLGLAQEVAAQLSMDCDGCCLLIGDVYVIPDERQLHEIAYRDLEEFSHHMKSNITVTFLSKEKIQESVSRSLEVNPVCSIDPQTKTEEGSSEQVEVRNDNTPSVGAPDQEALLLELIRKKAPVLWNYFEPQELQRICKQEVLMSLLDVKECVRERTYNNVDISERSFQVYFSRRSNDRSMTFRCRLSQLKEKFLKEVNCHGGSTSAHLGTFDEDVLFALDSGAILTEADLHCFSESFQPRLCVVNKHQIIHVRVSVRNFPESSSGWDYCDAFEQHLVDRCIEIRTCECDFAIWARADVLKTKIARELHDETMYLVLHTVDGKVVEDSSLLKDLTEMTRSKLYCAVGCSKIVVCNSTRTTLVPDAVSMHVLSNLKKEMRFCQESMCEKYFVWPFWDTLFDLCRIKTHTQRPLFVLPRRGAVTAIAVRVPQEEDLVVLPIPASMTPMSIISYLVKNSSETYQLVTSDCSRALSLLQPVGHDRHVFNCNTTLHLQEITHTSKSERTELDVMYTSTTGRTKTRKLLIGEEASVQNCLDDFYNGLSDLPTSPHCLLDAHTRCKWTEETCFKTTFCPPVMAVRQSELEKATVPVFCYDSSSGRRDELEPGLVLERPVSKIRHKVSWDSIVQFLISDSAKNVGDIVSRGEKPFVTLSDVDVILDKCLVTDNFWNYFHKNLQLAVGYWKLLEFEGVTFVHLQDQSQSTSKFDMAMRVCHPQDVSIKEIAKLTESIIGANYSRFTLQFTQQRRRLHWNETLADCNVEETNERKNICLQFKIIERLRVNVVLNGRTKKLDVDMEEKSETVIQRALRLLKVPASNEHFYIDEWRTEEAVQDLLEKGDMDPSSVTFSLLPVEKDFDIEIQSRQETRRLKLPVYCTTREFVEMIEEKVDIERGTHSRLFVEPYHMEIAINESPLHQQLQDLRRQTTTEDNSETVLTSFSLHVS
ncbi:uncharacterized protein LOC134179360 [Corticium candelabrum]|uniref:uncharacterized protein LOC134179360 n=1 Tax=Corticium candelabrum TaxID=121492 RepID=UPI002E260357|nr:uncharacterized protein LOC134179360 [Corticium candelabrum]